MSIVYGPDHYDSLESGYPYTWEPAHKGDHPDDNRDYHIDLGGGRLPKARFNIDMRQGEGVDLAINLDDKDLILPFENNSVGGIITHHCVEHIGEGFETLMEECYRILAPGEIMRIIAPLFPSQAAVSDYDHKRYFMKGTWHGFTGDIASGVKWSDGFAEPYNTCYFKISSEWYSDPTPLEKMWTEHDVREFRVSLKKEQRGHKDVYKYS